MEAVEIVYGIAKTIISLVFTGIIIFLFRYFILKYLDSRENNSSKETKERFERLHCDDHEKRISRIEGRHGIEDEKD